MRFRRGSSCAAVAVCQKLVYSCLIRYGLRLYTTVLIFIIIKKIDGSNIPRFGHANLGEGGGEGTCQAFRAIMNTLNTRTPPNSPPSSSPPSPLVI